MAADTRHNANRPEPFDPCSRKGIRAMTKAKTRSRRVWLIFHPGWRRPVVHTLKKYAEHDLGFRQPAEMVVATLTWTPPAKAKKRSAKR